MAFRDDMVALADQLRREVADQAFGLRLDTVVIRTRTWTGGIPGKGAPVDSDLVLDPVPSVKDVPIIMFGNSPAGKYEAGDKIAEKISATYTKAQLLGDNLPPGTDFYWLVSNEPFRPMGGEESYLGWRVQLRRMPVKYREPAVAPATPGTGSFS